MLRILVFNDYVLEKDDEIILVEPNWYSEMILRIDAMLLPKGIAGNPTLLNNEQRQQLTDIQKYIKTEFEIPVGNSFAPSLFCLTYLIWLSTENKTHEEDHLKAFTQAVITQPAIDLTNYNKVKELLPACVQVKYEHVFIDANPVLDITKEEIKEYTNANLELAKKMCRMAGDYDLIDKLDDYSVRVYRG